MRVGLLIFGTCKALGALAVHGGLTRLPLVLLLLGLSGCGNSGERQTIDKQAFLAQKKVFALSEAKPRLNALAKGEGGGGAEACDQAVDPYLQQAKAVSGDLDNARSNSNQTLNAATGGNPAAMAALLAAAAMQQQQQQQLPSNDSSTAPSLNPPRGVIQPSVVDDVAAAPALGTGGFGGNAPATNGGRDTITGGAGGGDNTVAHNGGGGIGGGGSGNGNGGGGRDTITSGVGGGASGGGGRDTITGGFGSGPAGGGNARDSIVGGVANAHVESVRNTIGSLSTDGGGGGFGGGHYASGGGGSFSNELLPPAALGRGPASAARVAGLSVAADVATLHGPGIFSLTTQTYSRFCLRKNILACSGGLR